MHIFVLMYFFTAIGCLCLLVAHMSFHECNFNERRRVMVKAVADWIKCYGGMDCTRYVKRLSHNDVGDNDNHQVGPYITKSILMSAIPKINNPRICDPDAWIDIVVDSHKQNGKVRAVWYNGRSHAASTRNEARLTNLSSVPVFLDHSNCERIALFAFLKGAASGQIVCHAWVCSPDEETVVEKAIGGVIQGHPRVWK